MDFSKQKNQNKQLTKGNYNEKLYSVYGCMFCVSFA